MRLTRSKVLYNPFSGRSETGTCGGGGVSADDLVVEDSEISMNSGDYDDYCGAGGGIYAEETLVIRRSEVNENRMNGGSGGGGVVARAVQAFDSTFNGNVVEASEAGGGGIWGGTFF